MTTTASPTARRDFLKFLAASPYVASVGGVAAFLQHDRIAQDSLRNYVVTPHWKSQARQSGV